MHSKSLWIKASAKCLNVNGVEGPPHLQLMKCVGLHDKKEGFKKISTGDRIGRYCFLWSVIGLKTPDQSTPNEHHSKV